MVAETTVRVAVRQNPADNALDRGHGGRFAGRLMGQHKHGVELSVAVAGWHVDEPAAVGVLTAKHARDLHPRSRRCLAHQTVIVRCMVSHRDMVVRIARFVMNHERADAAISLFRDRPAGAQEGEWKEAGGVPPALRRARL